MAVDSLHIRDSHHNTCWGLVVEQIHLAPHVPDYSRSKHHRRRRHYPTGFDPAESDQINNGNRENKKKTDSMQV